MLNLFKRRTPETEASSELQEARLALLNAQSPHDYAITQVDYHQRRVTRLTKVVRGEPVGPWPVLTGETNV